MRIPQHILEAINCGEVPAEKYYSLYGQAEVDSAVAELKKSDEEILSKYPTLDIAAQHTARGHWTKAKVSRSSIYRWSGIGVAAAAALVLVIGASVRTASPKAMTAQTASQIRQKGSANPNEPQLFIYRKNGEDAELLKKQAEVKEGDELQLAFNTNGNSNVLIFSVDGAGNVTNHYPQEKLRSENVVPTSGTTYLDYSYELDDAPSYEVFVIIASDKPFSLEGKRSALNQSSLKYLEKGNYVPENAYFSTFVLKK